MTTSGDVRDDVGVMRLSFGVAVSAAVLLAACSTGADGSPTAPVLGGATSAQPAATSGVWTYRDSYSVVPPPDSAPPPATTCTASVNTGWVARENRSKGTSAWKTADWGISPRVTLYPERPSTQCGDPVRVHLGGRGAPSVIVRAYRMGWYGGTGARLVWSSAPIRVPAAPPAPRKDLVVHSPKWAATVTLPVTASWPPGLYLVAADVRGRLSGESALVIRASGAPSASVVMYSNLTWNAYSLYGGASLYKGSSGKSDTRALTVSLQRPLTFLTSSPILTYDVPVAQMLDRAGVAADAVVDTDVDTWPSLLTHRTEVILPGHSEYWTRTMYDALTAARNGGANIADLGANDVYWHARVTYSSSALPASMFVARTLAQDPRAASNPADATVEWRQRPLRRNPAAVLGQSYTAVRAKGALEVRSVPPWLSTIPGLTPGAILQHAAWNETNGIWPQIYPVPDNIQIIALGVLRQSGFSDQPVSTTYYSTQPGGGVFDTGSTYWPCLATGACPDTRINGQARATLWAIMRLVLVDFETPGWGRSHPSMPTPLPAVNSLRTSLPAAAVGTYGHGD